MQRRGVIYTDRLGGRMVYKVNVVIEKDEFGYFTYCPELSGCHTQGDSIEEVLRNIKEAVGLYLETLSKKDARKMLSNEILTTSMEVSIV